MERELAVKASIKYGKKKKKAGFHVTIPKILLSGNSLGIDMKEMSHRFTLTFYSFYMVLERFHDCRVC